MYQALAQGRNSATMEVTMSMNQPRALDFALDVNKVLLKFGGRPHMGKTIIDHSALENYDFSHLKMAMLKYDPDRLCINEFAEKVFY